jgi:hypothetical protein
MIITMVAATIYQQLVLTLIFYWGEPYWGTYTYKSHGHNKTKSIVSSWSKMYFYSTNPNSTISQAL